MSELLLRGYNPAIRAVDDGVDIVLESGKTIQVKTVGNRYQHYHRKYCIVTFSSASWSKGKQVKHSNGLKADFVIIWTILEDKIFIIPANIIGEKVSITLGGKKTKYKKYLNNWDLLKEEVV